jgi:hypothetical protein
LTDVWTRDLLRVDAVAQGKAFEVASPPHLPIPPRLGGVATDARQADIDAVATGSSGAFTRVFELVGST